MSLGHATQQAADLVADTNQTSATGPTDSTDAVDPTDAVDGRAPAARLSQEVVRLVRATHALRAQLHARHEDGIEWAGYMLLFQLCTNGAQRSSALAASACVDPSTVSRQVAQLVAAGLVERRADPHDGRATLLAATDLGAARHRAVHERRDRAFSRLVADWPEADVVTLARLLGRLNTSVLDHRTAMLEALASSSPEDPS